MTDSLTDQAHREAIRQTQADTPAQFRVGGSYDVVSGKVVGGVSYDRTWKTGWGATAYLKAFWNDQAILPTDRAGLVVGAEAVKKF